MDERATNSGVAERAERVGAAFDASFRQRRASDGEATLDVLTVRVGDDLVGVLVDDVVHVQSDARILGVKGAPPGCSGIATHRSKLVAVFDLASVLGLAGSSAATLLLVSRRDPTIGFAATSIDRYRRVPVSSLVAYAERGDAVRLGTLAGDANALVVSLDALAAGLERGPSGGAE